MVEDDKCVAISQMPTNATKASDTEYQTIPRGRPKSGRLWKTQKTQRFSDFKNNKPLKSSWSRKVKDRLDKKLVKLHEKELLKAKAAEKEAHRKRQDDHKKQKLENQRKSEIVQPIKNPAKIKKMKKKQLRQIEKRDLTT